MTHYAKQEEEQNLKAREKVMTYEQKSFTMDNMLLEHIKVEHLWRTLSELESYLSLEADPRKHAAVSALYTQLQTVYNLS